MSEPDNDNAKQRRFWQIHSSTAVVLMFAGALLVGANFIANPPKQYRAVVYKSEHSEYFGWPAAIAFHTTTTPENFYFDWWPGLFLNLVCYSVILYAISRVCEAYIFRRRESRR